MVGTLDLGFVLRNTYLPCVGVRYLEQYTGVCWVFHISSLWVGFEKYHIGGSCLREIYSVLHGKLARNEG